MVLKYAIVIENIEYDNGMTFVHPDTLIEIFDTIEEANQFAIYRKDSPRFVLKKIEVEDVEKTQYTIPLIQVYVDLRYKKILKGGIKKVLHTNLTTIPTY
jgi:hypothetical protein